MARREGQLTLAELLSRLPRRVYRMRVGDDRYVSQPDAVNETLRADGTLQKQEARLRDAQSELDLKRKGQQAKTARRNAYKARKKAERELSDQPMLSLPVELMSDGAIDVAIAKEQSDAEYRANQPQIVSANPVWSYAPEVRRALGYYTLEEREQAARLNDIRSSTIFGNVMPNFGRLAAYYNPDVEFDAFRNTATYFPNALVAGMGFDLPSATTTAINGLKTGWQTAKVAGANFGLKALSAATTAAKLAAPVVTNPRYAATAATIFTPAIALASDGGDYTGLGFGIGLPLAIGIGGAYLTKGKLWGKTAAEATEAAPAFSYRYQPNRKLFTWEYPTSWTSKQRLSVKDAKLATAFDEWNKIAGDPVKESEFISKYNIRSEVGTPLYITKEVTEPKTYLATKMETVTEPVMESVPSSVLGPDGKPLMIEKPKLNADGTPVTLQVQRQVRDADGYPVTYQAPVLDNQGQPVVETFTRQEPKLDEAGNQILVYSPIDRNGVPDYLQGRLGGFTSSLPNVDNMIFKGPTSSQQLWMRARNIGRLGTWLGIAGGLGYGGYKMFSGSTTNDLTNGSTNRSDTDNTLANDSTLTVDPDSVSVRPYISVTPDGRVITPSSTGTGNDTIVPKNYETYEFDDEY